MYEIELYFGGDDPHTAFLLTEARTGTELANIAHSECKNHGAIAYSFGPVVPRDQNGNIV